MSYLDVLSDQYWVDHEADGERKADELRRSLVDNDYYWVPNPSQTTLEVRWDKSRLDALDEADKIISRGDTDIDPLTCYTIASGTALKHLAGLPSFEKWPDRLKMESIVLANEGMLRSVFARAGILEVINEGE